MMTVEEASEFIAKLREAGATHVMIRADIGTIEVDFAADKSGVLTVDKEFIASTRKEFGLASSQAMQERHSDVTEQFKRDAGINERGPRKTDIDFLREGKPEDWVSPDGEAKETGE